MSFKIESISRFHGRQEKCLAQIDAILGNDEAISESIKSRSNATSAYKKPIGIVGTAINGSD